MGRDDLLPPPLFARVSPPQHDARVNNTVVVAVIVGLLAGFVPLDYRADLVSIGTLVAFCVVSLGVIILRRRELRPVAGFRVPGYRHPRRWPSWPAATSWPACTGTPGWPSPAGWRRCWSSLLGPPPQCSQPQHSQQQCSQPWGSQPRGPYQRCSQPEPTTMRVNSDRRRRYLAERAAPPLHPTAATAPTWGVR